jgi:hypothetical protein
LNIPNAMDMIETLALTLDDFGGKVMTGVQAPAHGRSVDIEAAFQSYRAGERADLTGAAAQAAAQSQAFSAVHGWVETNQNFNFFKGSSLVAGNAPSDANGGISAGTGSSPGTGTGAAPTGGGEAASGVGAGVGGQNP